MSILGSVRQFWTGTAPAEEEEEYGNEMVGDFYGEGEPAPKPVRNGDGHKVVSIHTTAQLAVVICRPVQTKDAGRIADQLIDKRTVVLNLEKTSKDVAREIFNFISGVSYAMGGNIKRIATSTYIVTPYNVNISGNEVLDELENNGVVF